MQPQTQDSLRDARGERGGRVSSRGRGRGRGGHERGGSQANTTVCLFSTLCLWYLTRHIRKVQWLRRLHLQLQLHQRRALIRTREDRRYLYPISLLALHLMQAYPQKWTKI